jgi:hypothetical protein
MLQMDWARGQSKNKCWIVSSLWQKHHSTLPCQLRLVKLFLVRTTHLHKYQKNILILSGTFNFHNHNHSIVNFKVIHLKKRLEIQDIYRLLLYSHETIPAASNTESLLSRDPLPPFGFGAVRNRIRGRAPIEGCDGGQRGGWRQWQSRWRRSSVSS